MTHKYHATGWPAQCVEEGIDEQLLDARKDRVFSEAFNRYGIVLDREKMEFNPGLRFLAKQGKYYQKLCEKFYKNLSIELSMGSPGAEKPPWPHCHP
jgi:hypothetical protein